MTILTTSRELPFTENGFRTSWGKAFDTAKVGDSFHYLRSTAVTRFALVERTVPEIASFIGRSVETVQQILDAHQPSCRLKLAESAIKKLNAVYD